VSWFRIEEMFRFEAFHMYGIIGAAVVTAAISLLIIKRLGLRKLGRTTIGSEAEDGRLRRALSGRRLDVRSWMGVDGSLPGSARRAGRGGCASHAGLDSERARRHVDLRKASPEAPALIPRGLAFDDRRRRGATISSLSPFFIVHDSAGALSFYQARTSGPLGRLPGECDELLFAICVSCMGEFTRPSHIRQLEPCRT
jgi:hypothetical protein